MLATVIGEVLILIDAVVNDNIPFVSTEHPSTKVVVPDKDAEATTFLDTYVTPVTTVGATEGFVKVYETLVTTLAATVAAVTTALSAVVNVTLCACEPLGTVSISLPTSSIFFCANVDVAVVFADVVNSPLPPVVESAVESDIAVTNSAVVPSVINVIADESLAAPATLTEVCSCGVKVVVLKAVYADTVLLTRVVVGLNLIE